MKNSSSTDEVKNGDGHNINNIEKNIYNEYYIYTA
jgi:hypothetical protein